MISPSTYPPQAATKLLASVPKGHNTLVGFLTPSPETVTNLVTTGLPVEIVLPKLITV